MRRAALLPPRTLALAATVAAGSFADAAVFLLLLLSSSAHRTSWWVTAVVLANLIPPVLFAPVAGWLAGHLPGRLAWSAGLGTSALCVTGMGLLASPVALVGLAAVQSLAAVIIGSAVFTVLPLAKGVDDRRASSFVVGAGAIAAIGGPPLAAFLASAAGIPKTFLCFAALLALGCLTAALGAPAHDPLTIKATSWPEVWLGSQAVRALASIRTLVPLVLAVVIATSMEGVAGVFYLQDVAGNAVTYAVLLSSWAAGALAGSIVTGRRNHRMSTLQAVIGGGLLVSLALLIEGLVPSAIMIGLVFLLGGFGNAVHNVGIRNLVYEQVPRRQQAQVWAVVGAAFSAAAALGNLLGTPGLLLPARGVVVLSGALGVTIIGVTWLFLIRRRSIEDVTVASVDRAR